ncbi:sugar phosphate isomerase/epimerase [Desulfosporosinus sp.]|uniref:sugar phosphate isomerase/epimerase family protein n=1 Tax=Desulfosporosinus sp. TaxID=157907 RepID=UPI000E9F22B2|nr:sugar phosphate isomerase/epimerase family protein [Desulfosporosinus sp.]MBC2722468.1 sugar phosphate isomerase/epimerase [Desulfosporosinus sp.]MBC2727085.1 sugar phosphate isomerase/epimerase [Desulfosporosinus sp.]HBV88562.1 sugar phosphate isomerase/epimerase [Desulfosporosinus sp.]
MSKTMKLGLHTYTLHLWGLGENYANFNEYRPKAMTLMQLIDNAVKWGLDGLHITGCDLETKDEQRLKEVRDAFKQHNLYVEYNFSLDSPFDSRINDSIEVGIKIAEALGADIAKVSLDVRRPRPLYGSCFHPQVMKQLVDIYEEIKAALPLLEKTGIKLAIENHTDTFADEVIWLIKQINHPLVGACVDTVNSMCVLEDPMSAVEKLAPYAFVNHFCDHKLDRDEFGIRFHGVALGDGDIDCIKVYNTIKEVSPTDRITFEIEWDMEGDSLEVAQQKQLEACLKSIKYAREVLGIGK